MNELTWKVARPLTDEAPIRKLEELIGTNLPNDYVECVMKNNAGYPSLEIFKTSTGIERIFNNLLTFDESKKANIFQTYESLCVTTENRTLLPFAEDSFGNYICFDFSGSNMRVVFWEHETQRIEIISSTFTEFLTKLSQMQ